MNIEEKSLTKFNKSNPTIHKKEHTPQSSWIDYRVERKVQYMQINMMHNINKK